MSDAKHFDKQYFGNDDTQLQEISLSDQTMKDQILTNRLLQNDYKIKCSEIEILKEKLNYYEFNKNKENCENANLQNFFKEFSQETYQQLKLAQSKINESQEINKELMSELTEKDFQIEKQKEALIGIEKQYQKVVSEMKEKLNEIGESDALLQENLKQQKCLEYEIQQLKLKQCQKKQKKKEITTNLMKENNQLKQQLEQEKLNKQQKTSKKQKQCSEIQKKYQDIEKLNEKLQNQIEKISKAVLEKDQIIRNQQNEIQQYKQKFQQFNLKIIEDEKKWGKVSAFEQELNQTKSIIKQYQDQIKQQKLKFEQDIKKIIQAFSIYLENKKNGTEQLKMLSLDSNILELINLKTWIKGILDSNNQNNIKEIKYHAEGMEQMLSQKQTESKSLMNKNKELQENLVQLQAQNQQFVEALGSFPKLKHKLKVCSYIIAIMTTLFNLFKSKIQCNQKQSQIFLIFYFLARFLGNVINFLIEIQLNQRKIISNLNISGVEIKQINRFRKTVYCIIFLSRLKKLAQQTQIQKQYFDGLEGNQIGRHMYSSFIQKLQLQVLQLLQPELIQSIQKIIDEINLHSNEWEIICNCFEQEQAFINTSFFF